MFHGDVAIKNMILAPRHGVTDNGTERMTGVLIDFDQTLDLDNVNDNVNDTTINQMISPHEFMSNGLLTGSRHTYRHDLEFLFYVFLWLAIGNYRENNDP